MTDSSAESPLLGKAELTRIATECLAKLYDATDSQVKKLKIQQLWFRSLHAFSSDVMFDVYDDVDPEECPPDTVKCKGGGCMPPGQC